MKFIVALALVSYCSAVSFTVESVHKAFEEAGRCWLKVVKELPPDHGKARLTLIRTQKDYLRFEIHQIYSITNSRSTGSMKAFPGQLWAKLLII